ncbi:MAG: glycosyltransferase [Acidimicrobiia bacterium]|nr:glycosyltransferase [Acidimicrobiia bacterium]
MSEGPKLRVGLVAPPLPSPRHDGLELALDGLARGLLGRGHDVLLFTIGDPMRTKQWASEVGHTARKLYHAVGLEGELGCCDIVHDHTLAGLFVRNLHHRAPLVTTNYGPFDADPIPMYRRRPDDHVPMVAVSLDHLRRAPKSVTVSTVIHPGIDLTPYRFRSRGSGYFVTTGRMQPSGGIVQSIKMAKATSTPLIILSSAERPKEVDYFYDVVRPELGGNIDYIDDLGWRDRIDILAGADALLHPVGWPDPFGTAIVEAMACGTPTIATPGAAREIIADGETGFIAGTQAGLIAAVDRLGTIDRARCRERAKRLFDCDEVATRHEDFYHQVIADRAAERSAQRIEHLPPVSDPAPEPLVAAAPRVDVETTDSPVGSTAGADAAVVTPPGDTPPDPAIAAEAAWRSAYF